MLPILTPLALLTSLAGADAPDHGRDHGRDRIAVVVGANAAPPGRATLRYAHRDADRVARTLVEVGGVEEEDVIVLRDPSPEALMAELGALPATDVLVFYYSGHADDTHLFPGGQPLEMSALQAALEASSAELRVGVLDACRGGGWTGTKGLVPAPSFPIPEAAPQEGVVYLAASSGAEDAHEAELVHGSFFTHHWTGGLRGPADADADGRVTLDESFEYARAQTVRDSTVYAGEPQHPSFRVDLRGRDPVVLADLRGQRSTLSLEWERGLVTVHALETGMRVATLKQREEGYRLALPPGRWIVRREGFDGPEVVEVELTAGVPVRVTERDLAPVGDTGLIASKGDAIRYTDLMSPRPGQWMYQVAFGNEAVSDQGTVHRQLITGEALEVGFTDRVSWAFPASVGLRAGRREGAELLVSLGVLGGGLGYSNLEGFVALGDLGGGLDVRLPLSQRFALQGSYRLTQRRIWSKVRGGIEEPWSRLAVGGGWRISRDVTLHPSVSLDAPTSYTPDHVFQVAFGSSLRRNSRQLPLVQVNLSNGVTLDGHFELRFDTQQERLYENFMVGFTFASRKDAR